MWRRDWRLDVYENIAQHRFSNDDLDEYEREADILDDVEPSKSCASLVGRCGVCGEEMLLRDAAEIAGIYGVEHDEVVCEGCVATLSMDLKRFTGPMHKRARQLRVLLSEDNPVAIRSRHAPAETASRKEDELLEIVRALYPREQVSVNQFYEWLPSPITREPMQLDLFLPRLNLAFEYDGPHHSNLTKGKRLNDLAKQRVRDAAKDGLCEKGGVRLVRIRYDEPLTTAYVHDKITKGAI